MSQQAIIRDFIQEDMRDVVSILQSVSIFEPETARIDSIANRFIKNDDSYACVAERNGLILGTGSIFFLERIRGGKAGVIEDIAVIENERKKGIGALIVNRLIEYARNRGCFKITLVCSDKNLEFYKTLGFVEDYKSMKLML